MYKEVFERLVGSEHFNGMFGELNGIAVDSEGGGGQVWITGTEVIGYPRIGGGAR